MPHRTRLTVPDGLAVEKGYGLHFTDRCSDPDLVRGTQLLLRDSRGRVRHTRARSRRKLKNSDFCAAVVPVLTIDQLRST